MVEFVLTLKNGKNWNCVWPALTAYSKISLQVTTLCMSNSYCLYLLVLLSKSMLEKAIYYCTYGYKASFKGS